MVTRIVLDCAAACGGTVRVIAAATRAARATFVIGSSGMLRVSACQPSRPHAPVVAERAPECGKRGRELRRGLAHDPVDLVLPLSVDQLDVARHVPDLAEAEGAEAEALERCEDSRRRRRVAPKWSVCGGIAQRFSVRRKLPVPRDGVAESEAGIAAGAPDPDGIAHRARRVLSRLLRGAAGSAGKSREGHERSAPEPRQHERPPLIAHLPFARAAAALASAIATVLIGGAMELPGFRYTVTAMSLLPVRA